MGKQCLIQAVLESGSWGHSILQTPTLVCFFQLKSSDILFISPQKYVTYASVTYMYIQLTLHISVSHISNNSCLVLNHWVEFNQTCYMTSSHGNGVQEQFRPSVSHAVSNISNKHGDLRWGAIDCTF